MSSKKKRSSIHLIVFLAVLALLALIVYRMDLTVDELLAWTPENKIAAFFVVMAFFALKSLSVFVPVPLLYLLNGHLFGLPFAILVNLCGLIVSVSEQYLIGRRGSDDLFSDDDSDTLAAIRKLQTGTPFFSTYMLRMLQLPMDLVSMFSGMEHIPFAGYLLGSLAGMAPSMIGITITGNDILSPESPEFLSSLLIMFAIIAASFVIFYLVLKHRYPQRLELMKQLITEKISQYKSRKKK